MEKKTLTCVFTISAKTPLGNKTIKYEYETLFKAPEDCLHSTEEFDVKDLERQKQLLRSHVLDMEFLFPHESKKNYFIKTRIDGYKTFPRLAKSHFLDILNSSFDFSQTKEKIKEDKIYIQYTLEYEPEYIQTH
jgi:actin-related protein